MSYCGISGFFEDGKPEVQNLEINIMRGVTITVSCIILMRVIFFITDFTVTNEVGNNTSTKGPKGTGRLWGTDGRTVPRTKRKTFKRNVKPLKFIKPIYVFIFYLWSYMYLACLI